MVKADPEAQTVMLDFRTAVDVGEAVRKLTQVRPALKLVGMCTAYRKKEFESAGVDRFLVKPVIASVLFRLLRVAVWLSLSSIERVGRETRASRIGTRSASVFVAPRY